jgi:transmembrane sensor
MNENSTPPPSPSAPVTRDVTVLDWARGTGAADQLVNGLDRYLQRRWRRRVAIGSTACVGLLLAGLIWFPQRETAAKASASAVVMRPEHRALPDGSTVDLNAGADITWSFDDTQRRIVLHKGEAHFQVMKDARRPFVVCAGAVEVHAVGTAFAVDLGARAVDVIVTEGRVAVNTTASPASGRDAASSSLPAAPATALAAGWRAKIEQSATSAVSAAPLVSELSPADLQARLAWRVPRLKFASTPLVQVVAMFNDHAIPGRDSRLVLAPGVPSDLRVSGTLRSDDVDSLLKLLAGEFQISSESRAGEIVLRQPKETAVRQ